MPKINQAVKVALAKIELANLRIRAFHFTVNELQNKSTMTDETKNAIFVLLSALHGVVLRSYHDLFMFGNFIDETTRQ